MSRLWHHRGVEITWLGATCVRFKGREGVVVADPFRSVAGPTGRGLTADIVSFSHADEGSSSDRGSKGKPAVASRHLGIPVPSSLETAYVLDSPGEYEVHDIMVTGVRTLRDAQRGTMRGLGTAFVYELDGLFTAHLGDVGHVLDAETLRELGHVDIACMGIGPQLTAAQAAEIVTQLDATLVVPMPVTEDAATGDADLSRFLKEMSVTDPQPVPKLNVTISSLPSEITVVVLEPRGRT
jgi:L-ascorbate metabolism protein UlaG (beta-lactamase superfamily)